MATKDVSRSQPSQREEKGSVLEDPSGSSRGSRALFVANEWRQPGGREKGGEADFVKPSFSLFSPPLISAKVRVILPFSSKIGREKMELKFWAGTAHF
jgi:hypothetical protein